MKVEGGFLSLLASLASKVLPALGIGALSGLASTGVQKLVGNGLYIKKGGCVCEIETDGKRVLLEPVSKKSFTKLGDGLYLRKEGISSLSVQNLVCDQICQNNFFADIDRRHHNTCSDKTGIFCAHRKLYFFSCFKTSYVAAAKICPCKTSYLPRMCAAQHSCRIAVAAKPRIKQCFSH